MEELEPWPRAVANLRQVPLVLTPKRKVHQIRLAVGEIFACLALLRQPDSDALPGADDLLPLVILGTLRAMPDHLNAQLRFVDLYSAPDRLQGEDGFLLTQLAAATSFLENLDA